MPTEIRHIVFRTPELIDALLAQAQRDGRTIPRGTVEAGEILHDDRGVKGFAIKVQRDVPVADQAEAEITFDEATIRNALIQWCRMRSIPMPMRAEKALHRFGSKLGLVITMGDRFGG